MPPFRPLACVLLALAVASTSAQAQSRRAQSDQAQSPPTGQTQSSPTPPAQTQPVQTQPTAHRGKKSAAKAVEAPPAPTPDPVPLAPPNMLDQPAAPATVTAHNNVLAVTAQNSSLTQILHQVSTETGMQLDGLSGDERVFGSFGPGQPREVLTALLNGTGYNLVMVGNLPNGAPRELLLTHRDAGGAKAAPNPAHTSGDEDSSSDDSGTADDSDDTPTPPPPMQSVPQGQPVPQGVRTPQNWQQLQQMRNLPTTAPPPQE